jgi:arginyl-tRNA---protein transferase
MLIDRNWRRSGQYLYLPTNSNTCCPMYTIKCDANIFILRRSQKKILKKMNEFLKDGKKEKKSRNQPETCHSEQDPKPPKEHSEISTEIENMDVTHGVCDTETVAKHKDTSVITSSADESIVPAQSKKVNPRKKKFIRLERKKAKLAAKGLTLADVEPRHKKNIEKTLEDYLAAEPKDGKHKLKVKLVPSTEGTSSFDLFKKYQNAVHNDPPEKNSLKGYERFLVSSPLKVIFAQTLN